ncbi:MAG TPA: FAD-dependent oxidoreductase [Rhabdochlamydiaceae bacterium]|nr:FAD-dependent oxidoreductase [Rhabdochlamydiaceae bacterium]
MKIAVIGAGLSGLAVSYYLLQSPQCSVTLFDAKGIGTGASGVSSGLLHPYPAADGKRSFRADLALKETKELLQQVQPFSQTALFSAEGILREAWTEDQRLRFLSHIENYKDVEHYKDNLFLIRSALIIHMPRYLEALWAACAERGAGLEIQTIDSLESCSNYDFIVIAAGWGIRHFQECAHLRVQYVKGQKLICHTAETIPYSMMSKKYMTKMESAHHFEIGSTYERGFEDDQPCLEAALKDLLSSKERFLKDAKIVDCKAAVRVARKEGYLPIAEKIGPRAYVLTGMGSRGLLYHAYYGKLLAQSILAEL